MSYDDKELTSENSGQRVINRRRFMCAEKRFAIWQSKKEKKASRGTANFPHNAVRNWHKIARRTIDSGLFSDSAQFFLFQMSHEFKNKTQEHRKRRLTDDTRLTARFLCSLDIIVWLSNNWARSLTYHALQPSLLRSTPSHPHPHPKGLLRPQECVCVFMHATSNQILVRYDFFSFAFFEFELAVE